jgi:hypothetical protein
MKKIRGDELFGVIVRIYMEIPQGNSLYSTFISNKQKFHVFLFNFSLLSSTKLENRKAEQVLHKEGWVSASGRRRWQGKRVGG